MERGEVVTGGALDGLLDAMITRNQDRVGGAHVGEVPVGIGFATPFGEPCCERLTAGKHCSHRFRGVSAGDTGEVTEKERENRPPGRQADRGTPQ